MRFLIPPKALFLIALLGFVGLALGIAVGAWTMPAIIAGFVHHDWAGIAQMPRTWGIFPGPGRPPWYSPDDRMLWNIGAVFGLAGGVLGMYGAQELWRYIVVKKCRWMTSKEVKEFLKRTEDPRT